MRNQNYYKTRSVPLVSVRRSRRAGTDGSNLVIRSAASLGTWGVGVRSAAAIWGTGQSYGEDSIGATDLSLRVVGEGTAALEFVGSSPKWLWHPVTTDLGIVVVEEITATLVSISQELWEPVATHLGLVVVEDRSAALDVGKSQEWNSVAADLVLAVVSPVSAAFIVFDGSYWKRYHKLIAAHEELWVVG